MSDSDKTLPIIMICIILLSLFPVAGYLTIVILLSHYIRRNQMGQLFSVVKSDYSLIFLLSSFGLSALLSKQHMASLTALTILVLQVLLYIIIRSHLKESQQNISIIRYLLLTSLFVTAFGIFQYYFITNMPSTWIDKNLYNNIPNRAFSTMYNPNVLGSYLIIVISIAIAGFQCSAKKYNRVLSTLILVVASLCMLLTYSRGAWLGLAISVLIIFFFSKDKPYILSVLAMTLILAIPEINIILSRINLDFLSNDSSNVYRRYLWTLALQMFSQNPLLGTGLGSFGFSLPSHSTAGGYLVSHAHNIYLQLLAETGILGFTAFFGYILTAVYISFRVFRQSACQQTRCIALGAAGSIVGLLVHGTVDATLYLPQLSVFVWILIAVMRNMGDAELAPGSIFFQKKMLNIKPALSRIFLHLK
jgi:putative inorganic carbon (HCO3(-)) transporter